MGAYDYDDYYSGSALSYGSRPSHRRPSHRHRQRVPVSTTTLMPTQLNSTQQLNDSTSTSTVDTVACTLILYSKTYHRGDKLELPSSEPDLSSSQLAGGPVSAQLTGQCCWELHSSP